MIPYSPPNYFFPHPFSPPILYNNPEQWSPPSSTSHNPYPIPYAEHQTAIFRNAHLDYLTAEVDTLYQKLTESNRAATANVQQQTAQITEKDKEITTLRQELDDRKSLAKENLEQTSKLTEAERKIATLQQEVDASKSLAKATLQQASKLTEAERKITILRQELEDSNSRAKATLQQQTSLLTEARKKIFSLYQRLADSEASVKANGREKISQIAKKENIIATLRQELEESRNTAQANQDQQTSQLARKEKKIATLLTERKSSQVAYEILQNRYKKLLAISTLKTQPPLPKEKEKPPEVAFPPQNDSTPESVQREEQEKPLEVAFPPQNDSTPESVQREEQEKPLEVALPPQNDPIPESVRKEVERATKSLIQLFKFPEKFHIPPEKAISLFLECNSEMPLFRTEFAKLCWENLVFIVLDEAASGKFDRSLLNSVEICSQIVSSYYDRADPYLENLMSDFFAHRANDSRPQDIKAFFIRHPYITYGLWSTYSPISMNRALNGDCRWFQATVILLVYLGHKQAAEKYDSRTLFIQSLQSDNPNCVQVLGNTAHQKAVNSLDMGKFEETRKLMKEFSENPQYIPQIRKLAKFLNTGRRILPAPEPRGVSRRQLKKM